MTGSPARGRGGVLPAWLRRALLIAVVSSRRQVRKARAHPWLAFLQVFTLLFGVTVAVGRVPVAGYGAVWAQPGAFVLGRRVATGDPAGVATTLRGFAGVLFVLLVFLTVLKEATEGAMESHVDSLLLAAGPRSVAVGGILWSLLLTGWQFGSLVLAGAVAFGVGAGSPAAAALFAVAGVALLAAAVPLGFVAALLARIAFRTVPLLREHRVLVGAPLALVYFGLFVRIRASIAALAPTPPGWFADVGLLAVGAGADPLRAAGALSLAPVLAVGLTALSVPLAERVWYEDPPAPPGSDSGADDGGSPGGDRPDAGSVPTRDGERTGATDAGTADSLLGAAVARVTARPTRAVARTVWLRVRREPRALVFAAFPLAVTASGGIELAARRPAALPAVVAVYGAATVGMGATLNPLGAAGGGLPAVLTAPRGGVYLVRGFALSAALPGAPVVALAAAVAGLAVGFGPAALAGVALLGAGLAVAASVVSLAVGVAVPNLEGLRPTGSGIRPPRLWATSAFLLVMALVGLPALAGVGWAGVLAAGGGPPAGLVAAGGVAASLGLATLAGAVAYRRATAAIGGYRIE